MQNPTLRKTLFLAASVCLLIGSAPSLAAAQTETPKPASPANPTAPVTIVTQTMPAAAVAATTADVANVLKASEASKDWSQLYILSPEQTLPATRVSVDQKNAKIKDVLKDAFDQAKVGYVFDADILDDTRVSMKLDNVKIGTALDAITESAGLKWQASTSLSTMGGVVVRVGKNLPDAPGRSAIFWGAPNAYTYKTLPGSKVLTPHTQTAPAPAYTMPSLQYVLPSTPKNSALSAYTTLTRSQETRSTFTCPNCHNQVTILRKNVEVDCPTCHRPFEAGWKVCPFDGTKRPVAKDDWRFCPICGKAIPDGVASLFTVPMPELPNVGGFQRGLPPTAYTYDLTPFIAPSYALPDFTLPLIHPPAGDYK